MKKKIIYPLIGICVLIIGIFISLKNYPDEDVPVVNAIELNLNCSSAYLIEENSGKVLYAQNESERLHPASMTKMMGLILVCEKIADKSIKLEDIVSVSNNAAEMGGSQVFLQPQEQISVNDLLKSVCISSANDAMYALGELVAITNENFVNKMNEKAKSMGLESTNFVNVTGFDDDNHYTCAKDMAHIAKELLKYKDIILPYTSMYEGYIRENTDNPFWLVNTNKLVRFYEGVDGLKTGFTNKSGFCLTATAMKNNVRLISVIMNAPSSGERNSMTASLLDYGFSQLKGEKIYSAGDIILTTKIKNAKSDITNIYIDEDVYVVMPINYDANNIEKKIKFIDNLKAPLKNGDVIGTLFIKVDDLNYEFDLIVKEDVELLKFSDLFKEFFKDLIA